MNDLPPLSENDIEERTTLMQRDGFLVAIGGLSLANGMHVSPFFDPAYLLFRNFAPAFFVSSPVLVFYFTSLFLAAFTLILAGIPAALYERFRGLKQSNTVSLAIWLVALVPLTLPSILALIGR